MAAEDVAARLDVDASPRAAIEERFRQLLDSNGPALARLAASYTRSTGDRDDLLQEIAMAIWQALPGFRGECSERTFVLRIGHNRCLAHLSRRRPTLSLDDERIDLADPAASTEQVLSRDEQRERLIQAVRRLPLIYRQAITLALEGLSYRELADVLGATESNVGVRLNRGRQLLRNLLEEWR